MSNLHASPNLALEEKFVCISDKELVKYVSTATMALENMSCLPAELFMGRQRDRGSTKVTKTTQYKTCSL